MIRTLTCTVCPVGCSITVDTDGGEMKITGNTCPRGAAYAKTEVTNPQRTVTSTVMCTDGTLLPVKTDRPIPKDKIFECMKIINSAICTLPVSAGDVIIKDVFGSNIVAAADKG